MRLLKRAPEKEGGQALILFTFTICVLLLSVMSVIDVGMFLHKREEAQQAADAAALAGAQELPDSTALAQASALDYIGRNGLSTDNTTITFTCTSQVTQICVTGDGNYDTIIVTQKAPSPTYFGGVLSILGQSNCWVTGCTAQASAAGCRGACGPIGTGPADIMVVLDHSHSMSDSDIDNARDATTSMFGDFDYTYQKVGLAVTPPVTSANNCDAINSWSDTPKVWMPGALTQGFQTSPHVLNSTSPPVSVANCIDRTSWSSPGELTDYPLCSCHTDVGSAIQASSNELAANGRPEITWGMVIVTDGASNVAPTTTTVTSTPGNTGFKYCSNHAASSGGDDDGYQSSGGNGCASDNNYAQDSNSGTNTNTTCTNSGKDKHRFYSYSFGVPNNAAINGIEVRLDGLTTSTSGTRRFCVELSWNGGSSWTASKQRDITSTSELSYTFGGSADTWGRTWDDDEFDNSEFRVRVTDVADSTSRTFRLDATAVKVYYTTTTTTISFAGSLGPCDWAVKQATAAKLLGIEIYTIGFGVDSSERCSDFAELPASPYYNYSPGQFLTAVATDSSHYYSEPKSEDLEPIFAAIGSQLTSGSKLISCDTC